MSINLSLVYGVVAVKACVETMLRVSLRGESRMPSVKEINPPHEIATCVLRMEYRYGDT